MYLFTAVIYLMIIWFGYDYSHSKAKFREFSSIGMLIPFLFLVAINAIAIFILRIFEIGISEWLNLILIFLFLILVIPRFIKSKLIIYSVVAAMGLLCSVSIEFQITRTYSKTGVLLSFPLSAYLFVFSAGLAINAMVYKLAGGKSTYREE